MKQAEVIDLETHKALGWRKVVGYHFARHVTLQPVAVAEIPRVAQVMPVVFLRQGQAWRAAAVMGSAYGDNLYVAEDGRWRGHFVPAALRVYPFALSEQDEQRLALWYGYSPEPDSGTAGGNEQWAPFFQDDGYTELLKSTLTFLQQLKRGQEAAEKPLALLHELSLLRLWREPAVGEGSEGRKLKELYCVDATRLQALDDSHWLQLRRLGVLEWLYAHLHSLHHVERFEAMMRRESRSSSVLPDTDDDQHQAQVLLQAMLDNAEPY